jgi:MYXO-CTERM domain-containing protein
LVLLVLAPTRTEAVRLTETATTHPGEGITVRRYRTASPATDTLAAFVDLCAARLSVEATGASDGTQTTGAWAGDAGVTLAVNGDFYKTGPLRVYGNAVGAGVPWPRRQTGTDPAYAAEWYYHDYGYIAFGHDWVDFSHTGWVKRNDAAAVGGWAPGVIEDTTPPGVLSLVSGFPELVTEGRPMRCDDPTADVCFRDRSDMRARHPRTAMGLTQDRRTFILLQVDGRTNTSAGMYGTELADTMAQLGAWQAFNLDGGGSSQFWVRGQGYLNDVAGNNSGNGTRAVANHWGITAGGANPERPAHCVESPPCGVLPAEGGVVDDAGACFHSFGPAEFWRAEPEGEAGGLHWTNAWSGDRPLNWAWWQLHFAEAGTYRVEFKSHPEFGMYDHAHYEVVADGETHAVVVDQGRDAAWHVLGEFRFAAGGRQFVRLNDAAGADIENGRHLVADALRLTRTDLPALPDAGAGADGATPPAPDANPPVGGGTVPADAGAGGATPPHDAGAGVGGGSGAGGHGGAPSVPIGGDDRPPPSAPEAGVPDAPGADAGATARSVHQQGGCSVGGRPGPGPAGGVALLAFVAAAVKRRRRAPRISRRPVA